MLALRSFAYCFPMRAVGYAGQALSPKHAEVSLETILGCKLWVVGKKKSQLDFDATSKKSVHVGGLHVDPWGPTRSPMIRDHCANVIRNPL